jgi:hypothetical protein
MLPARKSYYFGTGRLGRRGRERARTLKFYIIIIIYKLRGLLRQQDKECTTILKSVQITDT